MKLTSHSFSNGSAIPCEYAFATIDPVTHISLSTNRNPHLAWSEIPAETQSFVLICHDCDAPSSVESVNQQGKEVPASLPRIDFFHWLLLDIPANTREITAGAHSSGITPRGKTGPAATVDMRHGLNDYTLWFANDEQMKGEYFGYDGPCPPWNDTLIHHYTFTLYAIDVPRLSVDGAFTGTNIRTALEGHVLSEASIMGTYTLTPQLNQKA